jgi:hypothetical protein
MWHGPIEAHSYEKAGPFDLVKRWRARPWKAC